MKWWAYLHVNGSIHVKRFLNDSEVFKEACESPFVRSFYGPYEADNRDIAYHIAQEYFGGH